MRNRYLVMLLIMLSLAAETSRTNAYQTSSRDCFIDNRYLRIGVDSQHPSIAQIQYDPSGTGTYSENLLSTKDTTPLGIFTIIGKPGTPRCDSVDNAAAHYRISADGRELVIDGIITSPGKIVERWRIWFPTENPDRAYWERQVDFITDTDLSFKPYTSYFGEDSGLGYVDAVFVSNANTHYRTDYYPLLTQIDGTHKPTWYLSDISGNFDRHYYGQQMIFDTLLGYHRAGEQMRATYEIRILDVRNWWSGLPEEDHKALVHGYLASTLSKWWRGFVSFPGFFSTDTAYRVSVYDARRRPPVYAPYREIGGDSLLWNELKLWTMFQAKRDAGNYRDNIEDETGFLPMIITPTGEAWTVEMATRNALGSTEMLPIYACQLYRFTKNLDTLRELMPRIRLAARWVELYGEAPGGEIFPTWHYYPVVCKCMSELEEAVGNESAAKRYAARFNNYRAHPESFSWRSASQWTETVWWIPYAMVMVDWGALDNTHLKDFSQLFKLPPAEPDPTLNFTYGAATDCLETGSCSVYAQLGETENAYRVYEFNRNLYLRFPCYPSEGGMTKTSVTGSANNGYTGIDEFVGRALFGFEGSSKSGEFFLRPNVPIAWIGHNVYYDYEYALSPYIRKSTVRITYSRTGQDTSIPTRILVTGLPDAEYSMDILPVDSNIPISTASCRSSKGRITYDIVLENTKQYRVRIKRTKLTQLPPSACWIYEKIFDDWNGVSAHDGAVLVKEKREEWAIAEPTVTLADGDFCYILSAPLSAPSSIKSVTATWEKTWQPKGTIIEILASNNGGQSWVVCGQAIKREFSSKGKSFCYLIRMHGCTGYKPYLASVTYQCDLAESDHDTSPPIQASLPMWISQPYSHTNALFRENYENSIVGCPTVDGNLISFVDKNSQLIGKSSLVIFNENTTGGSVALCVKPYSIRQYPYLDFWYWTNSTIPPSLAVVTDGQRVSIPLPAIMTAVPIHISLNIRELLSHTNNPSISQVDRVLFVEAEHPIGAVYFLDELSVHD